MELSKQDKIRKQARERQRKFREIHRERLNKEQREKYQNTRDRLAELEARFNSEGE